MVYLPIDGLLVVLLACHQDCDADMRMVYCPDHRVVVVQLTNQMRCMCTTEYHKWAEVIVRFSCKAMGVTLAWLLQRITSAIHCALRGAKLFASSAQVMCPSPFILFFIF